MAVVTMRNRFLASGISANSALSGYQMLLHGDRGLLFYQCSAVGGGTGGSAIFDFQIGPDGALWATYASFTATATETGLAQMTGYFPYVRCNVRSIFSAAIGTGGVWVHYSPMPRMGS